MMAANRLADKGISSEVLLAGEVPGIRNYVNLKITGVTLDSREVKPGYLFFACPGSRHHGMDFIDEVLRRGAVLVLAEPGGNWPAEKIKDYSINSGRVLMLVHGLSAKVSTIAARFYGDPAKSMRVMGVTGTNGKTSVSQYLAQALPQSWRCALMGTLGTGFPGKLEPATHTTADAVSAQRILADFKRVGVKTVAMEVSSHALDQYRVAAVPFHTAVFTNLSRDHLDYHGTMVAYGDAKAKLFSRPELQLAVINGDDPMASRLLDELPGTAGVVVVQMEKPAFHGVQYVRGTGLKQTETGLEISFSSSWGNGVLRSSLLGRFNGENLLLVLAVMLGWGVALDAAVSGLERVQAIAGRMQHLGGGELPLVVVDYAHTPDALEQVLLALRTHARKRLVCLFGCGGNRDKGKRPQMGSVAERLSDHVIVTDDNPRHEPSEQIIQQILGGMNRPDLVEVIPNRGAAISRAIAQAEKGDVVLIAGKGHEGYQQIGDLKQPFDDMDQVEQQLQADHHG